jgi:hypothetical protein
MMPDVAGLGVSVHLDVLGDLVASNTHISRDISSDLASRRMDDCNNTCLHVAECRARQVQELRVSARINYPKIAPDSCPDSRRGKGRIVILCNPCRNAEAGRIA